MDPREKKDQPELTVEGLKLGFPDLVRKISEEAVGVATKPLTESVNTLTAELNTAKATIKKFEDAAAQRVLVESVRKVVIDQAATKKVPAVELTEARLARVIPYLSGLEESVRAAEAASIVEDWKRQSSEAGGTVQHMGTRSDATQPVNQNVSEADQGKKPQGYISSDVSEAAKALGR